MEHVVAGACKLVRERFGRHDRVGVRLLAFIETLGFGAKAARKVRRLDERPGQILVAVLDVALALFLAVGEALAVHTARVGGEVANLRSARSCPSRA